MMDPVSGRLLPTASLSSPPRPASGAGGVDPTFGEAFARELEERPAQEPSKIADAARQFEALILGQILKSMHPEGGELDQDQSNSTMMQLGMEQFAQALAAHGGLGLARMLTSQLEERASQAPSKR